MRGRVGLDRSGSAGQASETLSALVSWVYLTDDVSICIAVLKVSNGSDRGGLEGISSRYAKFSKDLELR